MKNLIFFLLVATMLVSCDDKGSEITPQLFTVSVVYDNTKIVVSSPFPSPSVIKVKKGDSFSIYMTTKSGFVMDSITIDRVAIPIVNTYKFENVNSNHTVVIKTKPIPPTPTFTITATSGPNGSVTPSGVTTLQENQSQVFSFNPGVGYEIDGLKINDVIVPTPTSNSFNFSNVSSDNKIDVTFKKDSVLWPLLNIVWYMDSTYYMDPIYGEDKWFFPGDIYNFSPNGTFSFTWYGDYIGDGKWVFDKKASTIFISCGLCDVKINEQKMYLTYSNHYRGQRVTMVFHNLRYK